MPLERLLAKPQITNKPGWVHSVRYSETKAARAWNMIPSAFRALSENDQAEMIALLETEAEISAYENYLIEKQGEHGSK